MSVTSAVAGSPAPRAVRTRLWASSSACARRGREGAAADLHVQHQALQPGGQLLGQDAGGDQRHRFDRGRHVANGVQPPVGRRQVGRRADDGAAAVAQRVAQPGITGVDGVARQRLQLVQRAAGVAQATPADHRHPGAAGGQHRCQHQADTVAHAAGAVLVQHRAGGVGPGQHPAAVAHGGRQGHGFVHRHAAQHDGHGHRAGLGVAEAAVDQALDEALDLWPVQCLAVALAADQLGRHHRISAAAPRRRGRRRWP
jgi:hypothetical protein